MKLIFLFLLIPFTLTAQKPFKGFFMPLERSLFKTIETTDQSLKSGPATNLWLVRPYFSVTGMQFSLKKPVEVSSFNSLGFGISYQNIIAQNEKPFTRLGINAGILFDTKIAGVEPAKIGAALTISALNYIQAGIKYSGGQFYILTGLSYSFN